MSTMRRIVLSSAMLLGWTGLGFMLMKIVSPSQERILEMKREEQQKHPSRMAEIREQNRLIMEVLKEAAETSKNVAGNPSWRSG